MDKTISQSILENALTLNDFTFKSEDNIIKLPIKVYYENKQIDRSVDIIFFDNKVIKIACLVFVSAGLLGNDTVSDNIRLKAITECNAVNKKSAFFRFYFSNDIVACQTELILQNPDDSVQSIDYILALQNLLEDLMPLFTYIEDGVRNSCDLTKFIKKR